MTNFIDLQKGIVKSSKQQEQPKKRNNKKTGNSFFVLRGQNHQK